MKILLLFVDMVRPNLLNVHSPEMKSTPIDHFIKNFGGTIYENCYSLAPDTPRAFASISTGCYPNKNGCDTRIKWPYFYQNEELETIFEVFNKNNFNTNFYAPKGTIDNGPLSKKDKNLVNLFDDIDKFEDQLLKDNTPNSISFMTIEDYHWITDEFGSNSISIKYAQKKVADFMFSFFSKIEPDTFDHIFIFSDHGHKTDKEIAQSTNKLLLVNDDRTNVLMLHRKKGNTNLNRSLKLCSLIDLFPTLLDIIEIKLDSLDGISLFSTKNHSYLVIEDHENFFVTQEQIISLWRFMSHETDYITDTQTSFYFDKNLNKISRKTTGIDNELFSLISKKSPKIIEYKKNSEILGYYYKMKQPKRRFSDGTGKPQVLFLLFMRTFKYLNKILLRLNFLK